VRREHVRDIGGKLILDTYQLDPVKRHLLELLYDHDLEQPGMGYEANAYLIDEAGLSLHAAIALMRALDGQGLIRQTNAMGHASGVIDDGGREAVRQLRAYRDNDAVRVPAARNAVLACLYKATNNGHADLDPNSLLTCEHGDFYGKRFTEREIYRACRHLETNGLIKVSVWTAGDKPISIELTPLGEDCMTENAGDVTAYLQAQRGQRATYDIKVEGSQGINIGDNNTITQHINTGLDPATLREIIAAIAPHLPDYGDAEPEARGALAEVAEEAQSATPNPSRIRKAFGYLLKLGGPVVASIAKAVIMHELQKRGILLDPAEVEGESTAAP
jgi:hypothetical protein